MKCDPATLRFKWAHDYNCSDGKSISVCGLHIFRSADRVCRCVFVGGLCLLLKAISYHAGQQCLTDFRKTRGPILYSRTTAILVNKFKTVKIAKEKIMWKLTGTHAFTVWVPSYYRHADKHTYYHASSWSSKLLSVTSVSSTKCTITHP